MNPIEREEFAAHARIRLRRAIERNPSPENPDAYYGKTIANAVKDALKAARATERRGQLISLETPAREDDMSLVEKFASEPPEPRPSKEEHAQTASLLLNALPFRDQLVLRAAKGLQFTSEAIAAMKPQEASHAIIVNKFIEEHGENDLRAVGEKILPLTQEHVPANPANRVSQIVHAAIARLRRKNASIKITEPTEVKEIAEKVRKHEKPPKPAESIASLRQKLALPGLPHYPSREYSDAEIAAGINRLPQGQQFALRAIHRLSFSEKEINAMPLEKAKAARHANSFIAAQPNPSFTEVNRHFGPLMKQIEQDRFGRPKVKSESRNLYYSALATLKHILHDKPLIFQEADFTREKLLAARLPPEKDAIVRAFHGLPYSKPQTVLERETNNFIELHPAYPPLARIAERLGVLLRKRDPENRLKQHDMTKPLKPGNVNNKYNEAILQLSRQK
ncbi:TPA: hypothetical protein HA318_01875 [Candidatus Micrarchaeota archaeon]|nr:MAG: hypothetical protein AUJ65_06325 [Candidatus Micrarchaeota archaeon CG1_02_51_15]HII38730.1 hypothetical protein [Candidatus Micrarchaeota archaeon]